MSSTVYVLARDVPNPRANAAIANDWRCLPVIPRGSRLELVERPFRINLSDGGEIEGVDAFLLLAGAPPHQAADLKSPLGMTLWRAVQESLRASEPDTPSPPPTAKDYVAGANVDAVWLIGELEQRGKISIADVREVVEEVADERIRASR